MNTEDNRTLDRLKVRLGEINYQKLVKIDNPELYHFIAKYIELFNPEKIFCNKVI